jgi:hypothetical protein
LLGLLSCGGGDHVDPGYDIRLGELS